MSNMAYSSSDEEDLFSSIFRSQFRAMFTPQGSRAEMLIRSSRDPERLERWDHIGPIFHMLRSMIIAGCIA